MLLVLGSCTSFQFGAALATHLFPVTGAVGATLLRLGLAAIVLLAVTRPKVRGWTKAQWRPVILYGVSLAGMNGFYYASLARLPLSAAVTIQFLGPLTLSAALSRRWRDDRGRAGPAAVRRAGRPARGRSAGPDAARVRRRAAGLGGALNARVRRHAPRPPAGLRYPAQPRPALATLAGWLLLRQHSSPVAIAAVAVVITASVGSTLLASP